MEKLEKLIVSLTRLVDATTDLVKIKLQDAGKKTEPVQLELPFPMETPVEKPKRKKKKEEAEEVVEVVEPKSKTMDSTEMKLKVEFFARTMKAKGVDYIPLARKVISDLGYKKLDDVQPEHYAALVDALHNIMAQEV